MSGGDKEEEQKKGSVPMTMAVRRLFSVFPLRTFPAVPVLSPARPAPLKKPVLHVAMPHPGSKFKWASQDPRSLFWQMTFVFRGIDFDCAHVDVHSSGTLGQTPFLQNANTTIVAAKDLPQWAQHVAPVEPSTTDKGIESLLKGPLMAGVVSAACGVCHTGCSIARASCSSCYPSHSLLHLPLHLSCLGSCTTAWPFRINACWLDTSRR